MFLVQRRSFRTTNERLDTCSKEWRRPGILSPNDDECFPWLLKIIYRLILHRRGIHANIANHGSPIWICFFTTRFCHTNLSITHSYLYIPFSSSVSLTAFSRYSFSVTNFFLPLLHHYNLTQLQLSSGFFSKSRRVSRQSHFLTTCLPSFLSVSFLSASTKSEHCFGDSIGSLNTPQTPFTIRPPST